MARGKTARARLLRDLGTELVRFQDATNVVDDAAAAVLALARADLQCVSVLLFQGPTAVRQLGALLHLPARASRLMVERLELAGYCRRVVHPEGDRLELTEHARRWIETLWGPLEQAGQTLLARVSTRDLEVMVGFLQAIRPVHEAHGARIRALLEVPGVGARANRLRGGLSPAALRRVQLFVEANLERPLRLADLASRAGLSPFHFARAFRATMGTTPRLFLEQRRIERALLLLRDPSRSLAQVALEAGLGSQSRFTTTLRRATGFTPAAHRRRAT
jgi:AraC family transcriptional regulator